MPNVLTKFSFFVPVSKCSDKMLHSNFIFLKIKKIKKFKKVTTYDMMEVEDQGNDQEIKPVMTNEYMAYIKKIAIVKKKKFFFYIILFIYYK